MINRREFFADDDDGDEVTYVDHKNESNSQVLLSSVDCKNGCDENKPVIDDHMSFLLNDSLRGRKWKPDYANRGVLHGADADEFGLSDDVVFYGHGRDFNPHQLQKNLFTEHRVESRPLVKPASLDSPQINTSTKGFSSSKRSRNEKDVAFDRPSHWQTFSTCLKPRAKKSTIRDSHITPTIAKSLRTTESKGKLIQEKSSNTAIMGQLNADSLNSLSFQPAWMTHQQPQPSPPCVDGNETVDTIDAVDDFPSHRTVQSPSEMQYNAAFISPANGAKNSGLVTVSPADDRHNSLFGSKSRSLKIRGGKIGSIRAALEKVIREMDCNEVRLQTILCPVGSDDHVRSGRPTGSWDLQDPRNRARCSLDATILSIEEDRPPFHMLFARVFDVSLLAKNLRAPMQRTIGDDNSLCTTMPEPESIEQHESRTGQDQGNIVQKELIQTHISDLEIVKNHLVWLYMKPNLLRGVGKHLQVGRTIRIYDPTYLPLCNNFPSLIGEDEHHHEGAAGDTNSIAARFIILGTHCWESLLNKSRF